MLYYLSNADLLKPKAHVIQQMRMSEAFSEVSDLTFIHPSYGQKDSQESLEERFGIERDFTGHTIFSLPDTQVPVYDLVEGVFKISAINIHLLKRMLTKNIQSSDVIYSRSLYPGGAFIEWCSKLPESRRPKLIYEYHRPVNERIESRIASNVDGLVCITQKLKRRSVTNFDIPERRCHVAPDGVNLAKYQKISKDQLRKELNLPNDKNIIMYTGHLYPRKGANILADAAKSIDGEIYIVGGTDSDIVRMVSQYGKQPNIHFTGFVNPGKIHKYQLAADVLVAPYTTDAWMPSPLKLFEYMATGRPLVASKLDVIEEVIEDRKNGYLVEPNSEEGLAEQITWILNNENKSAEVGAQAKEDAKKYTWERRATEIQSFISGISKR